MPTRRHHLVVLAAGLLGLAACTGSDASRPQSTSSPSAVASPSMSISNPEPITGVRASPGTDDVLQLQHSGCTNDPPVRVEEDEASVTVTLGLPDTACEPLSSVTVELSAPLSGRRVIDGATGDSVPDFEE